MGVSGTVNKHLCSGGPDVSLSGAHSPGSSRHAQRPRQQHCRRESRSEIPSKVLPSPPPVSLIALLLGAAGSHTGQESGKSSPPPSLLSPIPKYKGVLADSLGGGRSWGGAGGRTSHFRGPGREGWFLSSGILTAAGAQGSRESLLL